jgi:putative FmdB family regulatory protein
MPIFEFLCETCGESFEELVRSATTNQDLCCPACQSEKVHKKISLFASRKAGGVALGSGAFSTHTSAGSTCRTST